MTREELEFYRRIDDMRGYWDEYPDVRQWRTFLREKTFRLRLGRSDLTQMPLIGGFDMHEGLYERRWVSKQSWQELLFAGPNVFILADTEHRYGGPPSRSVCYWLAVCRYGKGVVDAWVDSLPWKVPPSKPWKGTHGLRLIMEIPDRWKVGKDWIKWYNQHEATLDYEA